MGMSEQKRFRTDEEKLQALEVDRQETLSVQLAAERADDIDYVPGAEKVPYPDRKVSEIDDEIDQRQRIIAAREALAIADAPDYDRPHPDTDDPAETEHLNPGK